MRYIVVGLLFWLAAPTVGAAPDPGRNPARECAICHLNWVPDFATADPDDLLIPWSDEKVVASVRMCHSCHDGSVSDSRYRVWKTDMHKTGVAPSDSVHIPQEYPLDQDGNMQCATCHTAHGVDARMDIETAIFLREPNINSSMCIRCHIGKDEGEVAGQHPLGVSVDHLPHEIIDAGGKIGRDREVICESCHTPHGSTSGRLLVLSDPFDGGLRSELCESCHTAKPRIGADEAQRIHAHPVDVPLPESVRLPDRWENEAQPVLGDGRQIVCITCHSPHGGIPGRKLLADGRPRDEFCGTCHAGQKESIADTKHDVAQWLPETKNARGKTAAETGTCGACHNMHDGDGPRMWARSIDDRSIDGLCLECHRTGGVAGDAQIGAYTHPVGVLPDGAVRDGLPLFDALGRKTDRGSMGCATCHDVHGGGAGDTGAGNRFLRRHADGGSALCASCHESNALIENSRHDMALMAPGDRNAAGRTAEESGLCGSCHMVHNARGEYLWARGTGIGDDPIERKCTDCHGEGRVAEGKQTGFYTHPTSIHPAGMENGRLPLYREDGRRDDHAGGMTCATCHNVHAWKPDAGKGPGKETEGGRHDSFLRIAYDDHAALCGVCHSGQVEVIGSEHDLLAQHPGSENILGGSPERSGVCGSCHLVHNAGGDVLWGREPGRGASVNERQCRSCHDDGALAHDKAVIGKNHPIGVSMDLMPRAVGPGEGAAVLFDALGRQSETGEVACSSCHNPHATASVDHGFMRMEADGRLCRSCHGIIAVE